jgi:hypothetical protein
VFSEVRWSKPKQEVCYFIRNSSPPAFLAAVRARPWSWYAIRSEWKSMEQEDIELQRKVERAEAALIETVEDLMRYPPERKTAASSEALSQLRPHVETALEALETIERRRSLTEEECVRRKAFKMLLAAASNSG